MPKEFQMTGSFAQHGCQNRDFGSG